MEREHVKKKLLEMDNQATREIIHRESIATSYDQLNEKDPLDVFLKAIYKAIVYNQIADGNGTVYCFVPYSHLISKFSLEKVQDTIDLLISTGVDIIPLHNDSDLVLGYQVQYNDTIIMNNKHNMDDENIKNIIYSYIDDINDLQYKLDNIYDILKFRLLELEVFDEDESNFILELLKNYIPERCTITVPGKSNIDMVKLSSIIGFEFSINDPINNDLFEEIFYNIELNKDSIINKVFAEYSKDIYGLEG